MLITFTISIQVGELEDKKKAFKQFDDMLSKMEEIVAKENYYLDDARWDEE